MKDACVSYYHHHLRFKFADFDSSFQVFARDLFQRSNLLQGGFFEMLQSGWRRRDNPNLLFIWYEELKEDQRNMVMRILNHIGYSLEEEKVTELCEAMTFSNYRQISSMNKSERCKEGSGEFTRKGVVGDWVNYFQEDLNDSWNNWIMENLENIGITEERIRKYFIQC